MLGAMHRTFIGLKSAATGGARQSILTEVARGEAAVEASYDAALREALSANVRSVIECQHVRTREIRDRYQAMSGYRGPVSERIKRAAPKTAAQAGQLVRQRPNADQHDRLLLWLAHRPHNQLDHDGRASAELLLNPQARSKWATLTARGVAVSVSLVGENAFEDPGREIVKSGRRIQIPKQRVVALGA